MKQLKCFLLIAFTLLSLFSLPACSSSKASSKVSGGYDSEITVSDLIVNVTGINRWKVLRQQEFEKQNPKVKVNHVSAITGDTTNMVEYLTTVFMGKNAPSMMSVSSVSYIRDLYNAGLAADISPYLSASSDLYTTYDFVQKAVTYNKSTISYPESLEVPLLGFYNSALTAGGYDPKTFTCKTWNDYYEVAKKINSDTTKGASIYVYEYYLWPANWFMSNSAEPAIQNSDGTITLDFANPKMVQTLEFMRKLYQEGLTNTNISYTQISDMLTLVYNKKVASFTFYPTWLSTLQSYDIKASDITLTTFPSGPSYASGTSNSTVIVSGTVFNANKSKKELAAAVKYYEFMNGKEAQQSMQDFRTENNIVNFQVSVYPSIDWTTTLSKNGIPDSWISATKSAIKQAYVTPLHSTAFTTYMTTQLATAIRDPKVNIKDILKKIQTTATNEWLNDFNSNLVK